jgi:acyl-CoA reductase-like NAD-dependent aldehyde dehydrogenase
MASPPFGMVIDGCMTEAVAGRVLPTHDPSTGEVLADVACGGVDDVDRAVRSAATAADRDGWRCAPPAVRQRTLLAVADKLDRAAEDLARLESLDTGKPLREARVDVAVAVRYFEYFAGASEHGGGDTIPLGSNAFAWTMRQPYGVVGHIVPWNYPLAISARTVAPALAAGNASVLKPSELAPLTAISLGSLAVEAGLPAGCLNVVPGGAEAGAALAAHPAVGLLSFTGSPATGREVMSACSAHTTPVCLELGGSCPHVVLADADLDRAVPTIVAGILHNAGQTCTAGRRVVVDRRVATVVVEALAERLAAVTLGRGLDDPDMGPMISPAHRDEVASQVARATTEGATVAAKGAAVSAGVDGSAFLAPTLLTDVPPDHAAAREEIFGPVLSVTVVDGAAEAVAAANASPYGLAGAVWTRDIDTALWVAERIEAGQVFLNCYGAGVEVPLAGWKQSGVGAEKGLQALHQYTRPKTIATVVAPPAR